MSNSDDLSWGSLLIYSKGRDDDEGYELKDFHDLVETEENPPSTVGIHEQTDLLQASWHSIFPKRLLRCRQGLASEHVKSSFAFWDLNL